MLIGEQPRVECPTLRIGATRLHFVSVFVRLRRDKSAWRASDELRWASNEGTLRAFRNADRFTTFKIFRRPGALRGLTNQLRCFRSRFGRSN
jgi:hypothetical protein